MTDFDDNQLEDIEEVTGEEPTRRRKPGSRNFLFAVGALVAVFLITLIALVVFASLVLPQRNKARLTEQANIYAQNTAAADAATVQAGAQLTQAVAVAPTSTLAPTQAKPTVQLPAVTATLLPTATSVIALPSNTVVPSATETTSPLEAVGGDPAARTATVSALLTSVAGGGQPTSAEQGPVTQAEAMTSTARVRAITQTAASGLPSTGFADEVGLPMLLGGAAILIVVIALARRLRLAQ